MAKKVLIVYASAGMGHVKAAFSIAEAFAASHPELIVKNLDILKHVRYLWLKIFREGYHYVSAKKPGVWGRFYFHANKKSVQWLLYFLARTAVKSSFFKIVNDFNPDFFIVTHPLPVKLLDRNKEGLIHKMPLVTVITDYGCHSYWLSDAVNYYFVAADVVRYCLKDYGIENNKIVVSGIPIEPKFSRKLDRRELAKKFKINPDLFTILIVGGQFDFSALQKIISGIKGQNGSRVQFLVVAGRDHYLEQALQRSDLNKDSAVKGFGFIDNMEELMTVSDLMFSKAGGLTVSEAMAKGLPMIINKVIPGQEDDNLSYLVSQQAAIKVEDFNGIITVVNQLLDNPQKMAKMKAAAQRIGKPNAAIDLANFVYQHINQNFN